MLITKKIKDNETKKLTKMQSISMLSKLSLNEKQERIVKIQSEQKVTHGLEMKPVKEGLKIYGLAPVKPYV